MLILVFCVQILHLPILRNTEIWLEFQYYTKNSPNDDISYISNMLTRGNGYKKYISLSGEI